MNRQILRSFFLHCFLDPSGMQLTANIGSKRASLQFICHRLSSMSFLNGIMVNKCMARHKTNIVLAQGLADPIICWIPSLGEIWTVSNWTLSSRPIRSVGRMTPTPT